MQSASVFVSSQTGLNQEVHSYFTSSSTEGMQQSEGLRLKTGWFGGSGDLGDGRDTTTCTDETTMNLKNIQIPCVPLSSFYILR